MNSFHLYRDISLKNVKLCHYFHPYGITNWHFSTNPPWLSHFFHACEYSNMVAKETRHARINSYVSHDWTKLTKCFQLNASVTELWQLQQRMKILYKWNVFGVWQPQFSCTFRTKKNVINISFCTSLKRESNFGFLQVSE